MSQRFRSLVPALSSFMESHKTFVVLLYQSVFCFIALIVAALRLMWSDELATYYPAVMQSSEQLFSFFRDGIDVHTPVASVAVRMAISVFGDHHATNRLPMVLGFTLMSVCIYRFVSVRCPSSWAVAAMIFPAVTGVWNYATELRSYGLELGAAGFAMVAWQEAIAGNRRRLAIPLLWLSLAAAISCHYYAVFVLIPFGLAELVRAWQRRRPDFAVAAALVSSLAPLVWFLPAIHAAKAAYGAGMWSRPSGRMILTTYNFMLNLPLGLIPAVALLWLMISMVRGRDITGVDGPTLPERVFAGSLALLPFFALPLSYLTGGFVWRYVLGAVIGVAVYLAFWLCRVLRRSAVAGAITASFLFLWFCANGAEEVLRRQGNGGITRPLGLSNPPYVQALARSDLPVMVTPAVFYLQLHHYAPEQMRRRLVYAASEKLALQFEGFYTGETNLIRFSERLPLRVEDYNAFTAANSHYLVCAEVSTRTWQMEKLASEGAQMKLLVRDGTHLVFEVTR